MVDPELFRLESWTIAFKDMTHGPELFLPIHALEELQCLLAAIDQTRVLDLMEQLAAFVASQLGRDVIHHYLVRIFAQAVDLRTAKKELKLSQANIWQAMHAPLDDAGVKVTGEVGEGSLWVSSEGGQRE